MKKIHPFTTLAAVLLIAAIIITVNNYASYMLLTGAGLALVAFFASAKEVAKYSSWYQFSIVFLSSIVLGSFFDRSLTQVPFLTLALFTAASGSILRIVLFRWFGYTAYRWFEPLMTTVALGLYVTGNLVNNYAWQGWAFPAPIIAFQAFLAYGIMKDAKQLLAHTKHGYKIEIGKEAPDFMLPDQDGQPVTLASFKGKRDLLLIFVRGDWCPGCHMMLRTYEREREKFQKKNIMVMAIGPDPVGVNREMVMKLGLDFKVLSDEGQKTAKIYGIQLSEYEHVMEDFSEGIPLPASFLIDRNGIVRYVSRPDKVGEFLNPSLIFPIVESLGEVETQKETA
jgi:thioredoxin-dependent peroxiredoxin